MKEAAVSSYKSLRTDDIADRFLLLQHAVEAPKVEEPVVAAPVEEAVATPEVVA